MNLEKLTSKFQDALSQAQSLAIGNDHRFIEPAHLLSAMLEQQDSSVNHLLALAGANINQIRSGLVKILDDIDKISGNQGEVHVSNDLNRLLNITDKLAQQRKDSYISSELFILALVDDKGATGQLLRKAGASKALLENAIAQLRNGEQVNDPNEANSNEEIV